MAMIAPFRALRYDTRRIEDLKQVVIPPYDVISPKEREAYYQRHPFNMIRLELPKPGPSKDQQIEDPHAHAAQTLIKWQQEGVLVRDRQPALYFYELHFPLEDRWKVREGFMTLMRLEDFCDGCVRPHERTFTKVKEERFGLMCQCQAHLSPIFAIFPDERDEVASCLRAERESAAVMSFEDDHGHRHRVWRIVDRKAIDRVRRLMLDKTIFIADGHHRYETALAYRDRMRRLHPDAPDDAPFNYVMMYLSSMHSDGLVILPTHRLLPKIDVSNVESFWRRIEPYARVQVYEFDSIGKRAWKRAIHEARNEKMPVVGFYRHGGRHLHILEARMQSVTKFLSRKGLAEVLHDLDVVFVDHVLLRFGFDLSDAFLGDAENIHFFHDMDAALDHVVAGHERAGFFINPTRVDQVQKVAETGLTMPHKATYFYPKVGSGLLLHPICCDERVEC